MSFGIELDQKESKKQLRAQKKILLVGASGRVGRLVCRALELDGTDDFHVVAQYRQRPLCVPLGIDPNNWSTVQWDAAADEAIPRALLGQDFTAMILLAGITPKSNGSLQENANVAKAWLNAAHGLHIPKSLIASSSSIYGREYAVPIDESFSLKPATEYGKAKLAMEQAVAEYRDRMNVCCLRIGNVLGADAVILNGRDASPEAPLLLDQFSNGEGPVRSYIDPVILTRVLIALVQEDRLPDALNIACPSPTAMQDLVEAANIPWQWQPASTQANRSVVLNCQALERIYEFNKNDSAPAAQLARFNRVSDAISDTMK